MEPQGGALHIERRYRALFLVFETSTIEMLIKNYADVAPRGVAYTLRSVREARIASVAF